jgi:predicted nucleotide-binding protein
MPLPIRTTIEDILVFSTFLSKKISGATTKEIKSALGDTKTDSRRIAGLRYLGVIEERDGKYRPTPLARELAKNKDNEISLSGTFTKLVKAAPPYWSIIERAYHRNEESLTATEVGGHWHDHFADEISSGDDTLLEQVTTFFQLAEAAGIGTYVLGRRGSQTRFEFSAERLAKVIGEVIETDSTEPKVNIIEEADGIEGEKLQEKAKDANVARRASGQGIFVAHGKNKKPLEQLKKILEQFKIPYKLAVEEPNLGRPISVKVKETMESCNCAILIFTADEELKDKDGNTIWRPSENVVFELGAAGFLYENRIVIMKEDIVQFPSNFKDIGYISFQKDQLEAKAMEILKELIGFEIVKVST